MAKEETEATQTKAVNIRVPVDLYRDILDLAKSQERTVTQQALFMIRQWRKYESERAEMLERIERLEAAASKREPSDESEAI